MSAVSVAVYSMNSKPSVPMGFSHEDGAAVEGAFESCPEVDCCPEVVMETCLGVVSLAILALTSFELARKDWGGSGRWIYVTSATVALYLNVFVAVAQAFQKFPPLHALAPTGTEPAFIIAQFLLLGIFVFVGIRAVKHFHPPAETRASA